MEKQLPKNWIKIPIVNFAEIVKSKGEVEIIPYLEIGDLNTSNKDYELKEKPSVKGCKTSKLNDILISKVRPTRGAITITKHEELCVSSAFTILRFKEKITSKIVFYQLAYNKNFFNYLGDNCTGTMYPTVSEEVIKEYKIIIPPLLEQNRIVTKLDNLFVQLEIIKKSMANVPLLLKDFRQQVLTQAVTGKLTEEWRKEKKLEEWETVSSSKLFEFVTSGSRGWAQYYDQSGKQLFIRITNMNYGTSNLDLNSEKLQFLKLPEASEGKRTLLKARDILISITADIGMISLIPKDFPYEAYVNQHVCLARPINSINEKFLVHFLMSEKGFGQLKDRKKGATKAGLNLSDIKDLDIELPTIQEQQEIVSRVESLLAKADAIEQQYKTLKALLDNLPQALLHKAFKGELTEQLASDGDARELLKEIEALKAVSGNKLKNK